MARFGEADVERLMGDAAIVRNRAKIEAAIANAKVATQVDDLSGLIWSFAPDPDARPAPRSMAAEVPAVTPESTALAKALKRRGFRFVGPTTAYALMQACGLVDDHIEGRWARDSRDRLAATDHRQPHEFLAELEITPRDDRPFVFLNMVASVDGRATIDGRAHALGSDDRHAAADRAARRSPTRS